jgi:branched-chain amino acid transport system substrate-binding protein
MKKLKYLLVVVCSICCLSLSFVGAASAEDGVIKIGVLMNLTGPWASIDGPAWNSIQLAVKNINDAGGLLGKQVKAICIDTKADEAETVSAVVRLCEEEKVNAIIGYCDTHWVLTAAPIARDYGIPFVTAGATHPRIPERSGAWLACFGDNAQASVVAEYAYDQGLRNACVWIDTAVDFSVACCTYFIDAFKHLGGKVVYTDYYEVGWTDFSALVTRLKSREKEVDFTYNAAIPGNTGLITKQIREGGIKMPIISADGSDTPTLVEVAGKLAEGVIITSHMTLLSKDPLVVKYVEGYNKMFGKNPENSFAALGYDATMLIAEAIKKINSDKPKRIGAGLSLIRELPGVTGKITYQAGSRVPDKEVSILKVVDGKFMLEKQAVPKYMPPKELAK